MRHAPALSIAAAGAALPLRLGAAGPDPAFLRLAAEAWMNFEHPLLRLFFFMAILSLLAAALLNRRHRTELLATCLALSVVLHLLSLSVFSLLPIQNPEPAAEPPRTARRIKIGTRIANESRAGWRVRDEPLKFDRTDARDRTLTQRPAGKEPVAEPIQKTQTAPREPIARAEKQEDFTIPAQAPAKKNVDETLGSFPDHIVKAAPVRIEIPKEDQRDRKDARKDPDSGALEIDVGPAARAAMPHQALKPEVPKLESKNPAPLHVQAKINTAAVEPRQPEVKDAIQHSAANPAVDRLELPAGKITDERGADKNDASVQALPGAEVTLDKRAGGASQPAVDRVMMEAAKSAGQTRMSADSLADDSPGSIDGKQNEVQFFPGGTRAISTPVEPVRIKDVLPTLPAARSPVPGQAAGAPAGQRSLTAAREKSAGPGLNAAGERPRPEHNNAAPARAPVRVGLGGETPAEPTAKAPSVRDAISQVSSEQPGLPALGTPLQTMELAADNLAAAAPEMNNAGAQSLAAGKISGALATAHAAAAPVAPTREGRSQNAGTAPGSLVDTSGAAHGAGKSAAAAIQKQTAFAQVGDGNSIDHGLVVVGAPAQALESARGNMPAETPGILPASLSDSRARNSAMPSEAGAIERPAPAGRSNLRPGAASFVQHGRDPGVAARPAASPAPAEGEQAESPALLALAGGDAKVLAGRMRVEKTQGEDGAAAGQAEGGAGQAELAVDKAGGQPLASGAPARRFQAQAGAGIGTPAAPAATLLVQPALMAAGRPAASGTAENESLTALDAAAGAADSSGPALLAPTLARQNTTPADTPGILPAALPDSRARNSAMPSEAGAIERPAPAGRSNLRPGAASFVQHGRDPGVAARPAASPAPAEGEQAESPALLALAGGDAKALAGRMRVEKTQGEEGAAAGQAEGGAGQAELAVDKAGGQPLASGAPARRFQAQAGAGIGTPAAPAATLLVQPALMAVGRPAASGTAENESLTALDAAAGAADSSGPALLAPTLARQNTAPAETPETGGPAGRESLQLAKIAADEALLFEPNFAGLGELAETTGGADRRGHSRMDVALNAAAPRTSVTADISAAPPGRDGGRSFLPAGKAPTPDFVPEIAIYKMRKPEKRRQFIKELGGTPETEEAAEQALAWLSRAQSDDGRWDVDGFKTLKECGGAGDLVNEDVGVTGLVLLAYLGAGYTHLDGAYQETVRKGLDWLLSCEKGSGDFRGAGQMYGQAMATTALCESYALTGDERLLEPTRRAVRFILDSQTPESGWRYASQNESDTSVTGWQILALKSAQIAGFDVPEQTFKWMNLWLDKVRQGDSGGLYSYKPGHVVTPVMTAEGAFCQLFMGGEAGDRAQAESVAFIMQNLPVWDPENRSVHIYYWYYATLTMYLSGASEFEAWNSALTKALLQGRNTSGPAKGSWDPVCLLGVRGGRIYTTAVGALCLEVYYRFLPLYKQKQP